MARTNPDILSVRLSRGTLEAVERMARERRGTVSELTRLILNEVAGLEGLAPHERARALSLADDQRARFIKLRRSRRALASNADPAAKLAAVAEALGLPKDAAPETIVDALRDLIAELTPAGEPTGDAPDAPTSVGLSASDEIVAARLTPAQRENFIQRRKARRNAL